MAIRQLLPSMQRPDTDAPGLQPAGDHRADPAVSTVSARRDDTPVRVGSPSWPRLSRPRSCAPSPSRPADAASLPAPAAPVRAHASPESVDLPLKSTSTSHCRHLSTSPTLAPSHASSSLQTAKGPRLDLPATTQTGGASNQSIKKQILCIQV